MGTTVITQKKDTVCQLLDSVLSGAIVLYASFLIRNFEGSRGLLSGLFFLLAADNAVRLARGKRTKTQRFCPAALYLIGAVLILVLDSFHSGLLAAAIVEFAVLLFNRVTAILKKPKKRVIALNVICILIIAVIAVFVFGVDGLTKDMADLEYSVIQEGPNYAQTGRNIDRLETADDTFGFTSQDVYLSLYILITILWQIILHVVSISVSQMKLHILINIIRETYVIEILLGLLLMIIVCATIFSTLENSMPRYIDALWYCFALVTTIGFGDVTAKTLIGRTLSVMLGIYGIVVVAIITSVIVYFYGEVRRMNGQKQDEEKELSDDGL